MKLPGARVPPSHAFRCRSPRFQLPRWNDCTGRAGKLRRCTTLNALIGRRCNWKAEGLSRELLPRRRAYHAERLARAMGHCHCDSCRRWSAGAVNAFSLWRPAQVGACRLPGSGAEDRRLAAEADGSARRARRIRHRGRIAAQAIVVEANVAARLNGVRCVQLRKTARLGSRIRARAGRRERVAPLHQRRARGLARGSPAWLPGNAGRRGISALGMKPVCCVWSYQTPMLGAPILRRATL